jgi:transglutaminase-like putative cysteine protease
MLNNLTFLEEGKFTHISKAVREKAFELTSGKSEREKVATISKFLLSNLEIKSFDLNIFRNRTGSKILESGFSTGCSDTAIVFIVLSRASGIPTRYVETLLADWLSGKMPEMPVKGHVFVDVKIDGGWFAYEPLRGFTPNNQYVLAGMQCCGVGKGLDFSEIYLKKESGYSNETINLQSIEPLKELRRNKSVQC